VDFRALNLITKKEGYPLPLIEDRLGGYNFFDLSSGFYQVPMSDESMEKTAFVTPTGILNLQGCPSVSPTLRLFSST
jgi:hypothetical protein